MRRLFVCHAWDLYENSLRGTFCQKFTPRLLNVFFMATFEPHHGHHYEL